MDEKDIKALHSSDVDKIKNIIDSFNTKYATLFDFSELNISGQWLTIWNAFFENLRDSQKSNIYPQLLNSIRILTRDEQCIKVNNIQADFNYLLNLAGLGPEILWDNFNKEHKNRNRRHDLLNEIADSFGIDKNEVERKLKNLQSHFSRERKKELDSRKTGSGADAPYVSRWFAYQALLFLADRNKPRKTVDNAKLLMLMLNLKLLYYINEFNSLI